MSVNGKTIIRAARNKENPYFLSSRAAPQDKRLSGKARGYLWYLLSLFDNWKINVDELCNHFPDGRDAIRSGIRELESFGYIERRRFKDENNRFSGVELIVHESPIPVTSISPSTGFPATDFPAAGNPGPGNPTLLNTDLLNTDLNNNNNKKPEDTSPIPNPLPTVSSSTHSAALKAIPHPYLTHTSSKDRVVVSEEEKGLQSELVKIGFKPEGAIDLIREFGVKKVKDKLKMMHSLKSNPNNPVGWLKIACSKDFKPPVVVDDHENIRKASEASIAATKQRLEKETQRINNLYSKENLEAAHNFRSWRANNLPSPSMNTHMTG